MGPAPALNKAPASCCAAGLTPREIRNETIRTHKEKEDANNKHNEEAGASPG